MATAARTANGPAPLSASPSWGSQARQAKKSGRLLPSWYGVGCRSNTVQTSGQVGLGLAALTAECSGAKDALVPGEYAEILAVHANDVSPVLAEIEKDVSRTFPGNVFFGGDGVGVAKLRRLLIAYSWWVVQKYR